MRLQYLLVPVVLGILTGISSNAMGFGVDTWQRWLIFGIVFAGFFLGLWARGVR